MPVECPNGECSAESLREQFAAISATLALMQRDLQECRTEVRRLSTVAASGRGAFVALTAVGGVLVSAAAVVAWLADHLYFTIK